LAEVYKRKGQHSGLTEGFSCKKGNECSFGMKTLGMTAVLCSPIQYDHQLKLIAAFRASQRPVGVSVSRCLVDDY